MSLFKNLSESFSREAKKYTTIFLPKHRVDIDIDDTPISLGDAYCRIWLEDMNLSKDVDWFKQRYPVVHAATRFHYDGELVTIPYLAAPGKLKDVGSSNLNKFIQDRYALTPLFPFNQGLVEFQAGLFSIAASDPVGKFIETIGTFAKLLPVAELSSVLNLAEPVYRGIEDLLNIGQQQFELGYQQTFSDADGGSSNCLREGYFAIILAEEYQLNLDNLCVVNDNLRESSPGKNKLFIRDSKPFQGYSYMLFRIEKRKQQDWESLKSIKELVAQAQDEVLLGEYEKVKKFILPTIKTTIYRSPDITKFDRSQMVMKIEDFLKELGLQGSKVQKRSLYSIMQRPLPQVDATTQAELDILEELFHPKS
ncbi:hypothetical protein DSM106972_042280 [Dulcicalothrix desertica PCC 7102]|uniref:Uncharacterized protein n=1 Tax=Dulcicalothrix desertica PCC 7102 TaxID=232991 RepID=A0A3S1AMH4_9CYAN|nr:hypothetical protein [Dulcicalothrix desertica]RUT04659.1 hypothetical protein DSM106972_042280 [Dulcicalothrix desertica PCC 7102]TWH42666.1 hypothetical protein CAL7102_06340 [Dulcicalothrix desertica PCC 7102]